MFYIRKTLKSNGLKSDLIIIHYVCYRDSRN